MHQQSQADRARAAQLPHGEQRLPDGLVEEHDDLGIYAAEHGISAHGQMLGYLGETALYNAINFNWGMNVNATCGPIQSTVYTTQVNEFLCPSDRQRGRDESEQL